MRKNIFILVFALMTIFVINSAMADSNDCSTTVGPIYTDTGVSIR